MRLKLFTRCARMKAKKGVLIVSTPHNSASPGDFAKTVLMPGDPMRSKFIAETYLENPICVNNVRGIQGYTGTYNGKRVSVMASGMGIPSISIYSYELFHFYGVENIIRVGTIGSLVADINPRDIIIAESALCDMDLSVYYPRITDDAYKCSPVLLQKAISRATQKGLKFFVGPVYSTEIYYPETDIFTKYADKGAIGAEMEAAALYCNAYIAGKNALAVCTVSDNVITGEEISSAEKESGLCAMIELALDIA